MMDPLDVPMANVTLSYSYQSEEILETQQEEGEIPISPYASLSSSLDNFFVPRPFVTSVVSLLSKDEIEEIIMVYRIPTTFKAYSCGRDQATNGLV